jgi:two-component sensor histidine kinase
MHASGREYDLREVVTALVMPYETLAAPVDLEQLPTCVLEQGEVDALAMVLGELCVNSIKHGALGSGDSVAVSGTCDTCGVALEWSEHSNKPVSRHAREGGQGLKIMQRVLAARNGTISLGWHHHGVDVRFGWSRPP